MTLATLAPRKPRKRLNGKYVLWTVMGLLALSVVIFTEIPIFGHPNPERTHLHADGVVFLAHAFAGLSAFLIGPLNFSTRLRQRNLPLHRLLGKIYVICILIAAPTAMFLSHRFSRFDFIANCVQGSLWILTTLFAWQTARNKQIVAHRMWMIRSYAVTFIFITSRVLNAFAWYQHLSDDAFSLGLLLFNIAALFLPDVYFSWRELTTKRT